MAEGFKVRIPIHKATELRGRLIDLLVAYDAPHLPDDQVLIAFGDVEGLPEIVQPEPTPVEEPVAEEVEDDFDFGDDENE